MAQVTYEQWEALKNDPEAFFNAFYNQLLVEDAASSRVEAVVLATEDAVKPSSTVAHFENGPFFESPLEPWSVSDEVHCGTIDGIGFDFDFDLESTCGLDIGM